MKEIQLPKFYQAYQFSEDNNVVHFVEEIRRKTTNTNFSTNVLEKIIKNNVDKQIYKNLKIQVLMKDHTIEDIIRFFIKNYASPRELEENLMKYHQKIGTLKSSQLGYGKKFYRNSIGRITYDDRIKICDYS